MIIEMQIELSREWRKFQLDFGHLISPKASIYISNRYDVALEKDPEEGSQVIHLINELRELYAHS